MRRQLARSVVLLVATIAGVLHWETRRLEAANTSFTPLRVPPRYRPAVALIPAFVRDGVPLDAPLAVPLRLRAGQTLGQVLVDQGLEVRPSATPDELRLLVRAELGADGRQFAAALAEARFGPPETSAAAAARAHKELHALLRAIRRGLGRTARLRGFVALRSLRA